MTREFIRGQLAYMLRTKTAWRDAGDEFIDGWIAAKENDRRMGKIEGVPV